jgi:hypothetical protein
MLRSSSALSPPLPLTPPPHPNPRPQVSKDTGLGAESERVKLKLTILVEGVEFDPEGELSWGEGIRAAL